MRPFLRSRLRERTNDDVNRGKYRYKNIRNGGSAVAPRSKGQQQAHGVGDTRLNEYGDDGHRAISTGIGCGFRRKPCARQGAVSYPKAGRVCKGSFNYRIGGW